MVASGLPYIFTFTVYFYDDKLATSQSQLFIVNRWITNDPHKHPSSTTMGSYDIIACNNRCWIRSHMGKYSSDRVKETQ